MSNETTEQKKHTLVKIAEELKNKGVFDLENSIQTALLLAYSAAANDVFNQNAIDVPLYKLKKDENSLEVEELNGRGKRLRENEIEITALDLYKAANIRDINLLLEGDTGVGKTLTLETFLSTTQKTKAYDFIRLSANIMFNDVFAPYTKIDASSEIPKVVVDFELLKEKGALFIDEENRGETNKILQLKDGVIVDGGKQYRIGIPILKLEESDEGFNLEKTDKIKKLWVVSAQNPSGDRDDKFTETTETDAAVGNRSLKIEFPNIAPSSSVSIWYVDKQNSRHEKFAKRMSYYLKEYTGVELEAEDIEQDWLDIFAYFTDTEKTDKMVTFSSVEFADLLVLSLFKEKEEINKTEVTETKEILEEIKEKYSLSVNLSNITEDLDTTSTEIKDLLEITDDFREDTINRDISNIKKLADLISTIRGLKELKKIDPESTLQEEHEHYKNNKRKDYMTFYDVAVAASMITNSKIFDPEELKEQNIEVSKTINNLLIKYSNLLKKQLTNYGINAELEETDSRLSLKTNAINKALNKIYDAGEFTAEAYIKELGSQIKEIDKLVESGDEIGKYFAARITADLAIYTAYIMDNEKEITEKIKELENLDKKEFIVNFKNYLKQNFLDKATRKGNRSLDTVYIHRMPRILSINLGGA
ncbi:hypothetical protein DRJ22_04220 [Candidatus Woesearchaeota archaeon]|nr:MAG: hypothetical protein DRJ22_04220 [Candidatus Woesearchaeota archaeon]